MSDLEDTFGAEFAQNIQEKTAERRQERNRVSEEQLAKICAKAINESKFDDGEPQFKFTTENGLTHTVLLVQVPDPNEGEVWKHLSEPWEGAARLPLSYLGEWYWSTFPQKEDLKKLGQGDWAIVVGEIEENENDSGDTFKNIYPVRGIATLDEAKEYAEMAMSEEGFGSDEEEEEEDDDSAADPDDFADDDEEEEEDDDDSSGSMFGGDGDDDEEDDDEEESSDGGGLTDLAGMDEEEEEEDEDDEVVNYDEVAHFVEELAEKQDEDEEPQIFDLTKDTDEFARLVNIVCDQLGYEDDESVAEVVNDVIQGNSDDDEEEEEEEEEDDLDGKLF